MDEELTLILAPRTWTLEEKDDDRRLNPPVGSSAGGSSLAVEDIVVGE
jgi:hypothetical protein